MRITIDVTKRDITKAASDVFNCPIRLAVRRALGVRVNSHMGKSLLVNDTNIVFEDCDSYSYDEIDLATLPKAAQDFVSDYDDDKTVEPFSFVANFNQSRAKDVGLTLPTA